MFYLISVLTCPYLFFERQDITILFFSYFDFVILKITFRYSITLTSNWFHLQPSRPYPSHGGHSREAAILMLRRFYLRENVKGRP
jgi:hypothetical protein